MRDGTLTGISLSRPLPSGLITAEFSNADTQQQIRKVTSQSLSYLFIYQLIVALLQFFRSVYTWNELIDHFFHLTLCLGLRYSQRPNFIHHPRQKSQRVAKETHFFLENGLNLGVTDLDGI